MAKDSVEIRECMACGKKCPRKDMVDVEIAIVCRQCKEIADGR